MTVDVADSILGRALAAASPAPIMWLQLDAKAIAFTIHGQAMSKANSRQLVFGGKREDRKPMFIKSAEALQFERDALLQIPSIARQRLEGPVCVTLRIFYASERPDLDESLILDVLQDQFAYSERRGVDGVKRERRLTQSGVYRNDRQVREKHIFWGIDRANPRVEVLVEPMQAQQLALA